MACSLTMHVTSTPSCFSPSLSVWDIEEGAKLVTEHYNSQARITAAEFINPHDITFLLTGSGSYCPLLHPAPPPYLMMCVLLSVVDILIVIFQMMVQFMFGETMQLGLPLW